MGVCGENINNNKEYENNKFETKSLKKLKSKKNSKYSNVKKNLEDKKELINNQIYDIILNFESIKQLKEIGCEIKFSKNGKEKYEKCKNKNNITIGILGENKIGKSYILQRILNSKKYLFPNGFLISTQNISTSFPYIEKNKCIFALDTTGIDKPLIQTKFYNNKDEKTFLKMVKDQKLTEYIIQDFIINEAIIPIVVLGQLTFTGQMFLLNFIKKIEKKNNGNKHLMKNQLIVIHNLLNITKIESIQKYIDNTLLKSATFILRKEKYMNNESYDNKGYFYEQNNNYVKIFHFVIGNDSINEIKKEYNEPAINKIRNIIKFSYQKKYDFINSFKDLIINNSRKYFYTEGFQQDSLYIDDTKENLYLNLKRDYKNIGLKEINTKGIYKDLSKDKSNYSVYFIKKENKYYIEIEFEMHGKINNLKSKIINEEETLQYLIIISGNTEDCNNINKDICKGNLKYKNFLFYAYIDKKFKYKKRNCFIKIIEDNYEKIENTIYGVYRLIYPLELKDFDGIDNEEEDKEE